jgi:hypothetical protein
LLDCGLLARTLTSRHSLILVNQIGDLSLNFLQTLLQNLLICVIGCMLFVDINLERLDLLVSPTLEKLETLLYHFLEVALISLHRL